MVDREETILKINTFLIEEFELEQHQLVQNASLKDDLDIESLDFVDIAVILENNFGVKVSSEHLGKIITLRDLYQFVIDYQEN
ncbi:MAG: acyl carrier protein [Bacteroidetes bacterium CG18_big_fil_WC_8_21_14_2_50_41_14]|nr:MAG: acyl carrier protein [Bacteroidetes bacterium CG18_big_fil_WC_8_21_14_2_50_41_14]PJB59119.1 MAG: acyl carrier protein [Bacteroidetes bacterium CG_4_9_14_3_um_filter_41_19]